ncbi:MAG: HAMP domain-containing histidine kinase [Lachnospiraceae bacterium]|nr:HAMP domain-containing histidine kinase [Lachnospiraceae bacterium]
MEKILIIICSLLVLICIILTIRIGILKKEMRDITVQIKEKQKNEKNQPVTVGSFGASSVDLANAINDYVSELEGKLKEYAADREHLQRIIAGISHDFRTPLTSVDGYLQLINKSDELSDKEKEYLNVVINKVKFLRELSDDFLDLSIVENNESVEKNEISLIPFISEIILEQNEWIEARGIKADFSIPEKDIKLAANEHDLRRILENIFSNSRKYAENWLKLSIVDEHDENVLRIIFENDVADGNEIDIDEIFEPFVRSKDRHGEGSGLGLYVVKRLCDKLGYDVEASFKNKIFRLELLIKSN